MGKIIAVINQKGGVGKSSTAQALTAGLTLKGFKVLVCDIDPQGNTSFSFNANRDGATILAPLLGEIPAADAVQHTKYGDMIASSKTLSGADTFITETGKEYKLKEALEPLKNSYDYIVLDTPPSLGILSVNALTAADSIVIPALPDIYSLQGIADLMETIQPVKKYCNRALKIEGILFTRYNSRSSFNGEVTELADEMAANLKTKVFKTVIREAVSVRKAQAVQQSLFEYDPKGKVAADYMSFIDELLQA